MPFKFMRWTMPGGEIVNLRIDDSKKTLADYSVVDVACDQNRLRHMLSVLYNTEFYKMPVLPPLHELVVTFNGLEYRLWVYTRNWKDRAAFLSGVLVGQSRLWKKRRRRHKVRVVS